MKLKIILITTLLILTSTIISLNCQTWKYNVSDERIKGNQIVDVITNDNLFLTFTMKINFIDTLFYLEYIDDNKVRSLQLDGFGKPDPFLAARTKMKTDYEGNIWFSMDKLWKYSNGNIETFDIFVDLFKGLDLDTHWRKIVDFEFDNSGNIWIATQYDVLLYQKGPDKIVKGYGELFKYNSNGLERVKFDSIAYDGNYEFFGYQYMDRAEDGTIFLSIRREKDNLMIIENEEIIYRTLEGLTPSPERNVTGFQIKNKDEFYVTYKNLQFIEPIRFGGISHYKNGVWKHYNVNDGLPLYDKHFIYPGRDTINEPADVYSVYLDNEGNHYFATVGAILKITKDDEIIVYDGKEIVKNSPMFGVEHFNNSYKDYWEPVFENVAKVNNKLYATVMYGILEIDEGTLSVNKEANKQLKVFPNPIVNDYANIELPENEILNSISLIDLSGAKIDAEYNLNSSNIELDCSKLSNGTYIVLTRTNKDLYYSKLIVKRK